MLNLYPEANIPDAAFPDPNFRQVVLASFPTWQFDVKIDHQISANHKINGRYSRHHDVFTVPTVFGNDGDGVIYTTDVHNTGLEYSWTIAPTVLWSNRLSVDRVVAPGKSNNYPTLESVGFDSLLGGNGLDRMAKAVLPTGPSTPEIGSTSAVEESASARPSATAACTEYPARYNPMAAN